MSEGYSVTMQPSLELNQLVAKMIGWTGEPLPRFSIDPAAAMEAWAWLEENNPWSEATLMLGRDKDTGNPAVIRWDVDDGYWHNWQPEVIATGTTYPHAIALAILEVGRHLGMIE